ncbi:hypothetical protein [Alcanivorax sp. 1008]|uniref:hypothetical protein n=1 Tax=Alcanivorax sp. 1008 TaxID=2816853 RepID=UPI001D6E0A30|nr:hypothetical protein [Alcanivorax sp. 1008]MCC1498091.1 hypothetical protein [Alcanivorax sp. 1008]
MSRPRIDIDEAILTIRAYIKNNPQEKITWKRVVALTDVSRSTLFRSKEVTEIISRHRDLASAPRSGNGNGLICDGCGFPIADKEYFSRTIEMHHKREAKLIEIMKERGINLIEIASLMEDAG